MIEIFHNSYRIQPGKSLPAEVEEGNHEYKIKLTNLTDVQLNHRITQLQWRLTEGNNEAFYHIGVEDNGFARGITEGELRESLQNLQFMANAAQSIMTVQNVFSGENGYMAEVCVRRKERAHQCMDSSNHIYLAIAGGVSSGKSSFLGVLTTGKKDNGRGLARNHIFTHNHEIMSGHTSALSYRYSLTFNERGQMVSNQSTKASSVVSTHRGKLTEVQADSSAFASANRVVQCIDLAGHEKYLKTTLSGILSNKLDYLMLCVSSVSAINKTGQVNLTTYEEDMIRLACQLDIPLIFNITKIDLIPNNIDPIERRDEILTALEQLIVRVKGEEVNSSSKKRIQLIDGSQAIDQFISEIDSNQINRRIPAICTSNLTGEGLELAKCLIYRIPATLVASSDMKVEHPALVEGSNAETSPNSTVIRVLGSIGRSPLSSDGQDEGDDYDWNCEADLMDDCDCDENKATEGIESANMTHPAILAAFDQIDCEFIGSNSSSAPLFSPKGVKVDNNSINCIPSELSRYKRGLVDFLDYVDLNSSLSAKVLIVRVASGTLELFQQLYLGPTSYNARFSATGVSGGDFLLVQVISMRYQNIPVKAAQAGQTITIRVARVQAKDFDTTAFPLVLPRYGSTPENSVAAVSQLDGAKEGLKSTKTDDQFKDVYSIYRNEDLAQMSCIAKRRTQINGLTLISPRQQYYPAKPFDAFDHIQATSEFEVRVEVKDGQLFPLKVNQEPIIYITTIRQAVKVVAITSDAKGNDACTVAVVRLRFLYSPQFIVKGENMVITEEKKIIAIGKISTVFR